MLTICLQMTFDISLFKPVSWAIYWFCYFCWRIIKACTKALESKESVCFLKRDESGNSQSQGKPRFNKLEIFVSKRASSSARISQIENCIYLLKEVH